MLPDQHRVSQGRVHRERFGEVTLPSVSSRLFLADLLADLGEFAEGIARGEEGVRIAETVGHPFSLIGALRALGRLYLRKGDLKEAISVLERGRELCQVWKIPTWRYGIASNLGYGYVLSGRLADGLPLLEQGLEQAFSMGDRTGYVRRATYLSEAYHLANRTEDAVRLGGQALAFARDHKRRAQQPLPLLILGEIASHRDPPAAEEAGASFGEAMALADELGMRPIVAHCHFGFGKLYGRVGKREEAQEHFTISAEMYRAMDMRSWLEKAEVEVSRL
jgi:tetratricopeptide (TPR) repeat protein